MSGIKDAKRNRKRRRRNRRIRLVFYAILLICAALILIQGIRVVAPKIGNAVATLAESIKEASEKRRRPKKIPERTRISRPKLMKREKKPNRKSK